METKLFFRVNPAFLFATLIKVMQNVEDEYSRDTLTRRTGIVTNSAKTIPDPVLKVYWVMYLTKIFKRR